MAENNDLRLFKKMYLHLFNAVTDALAELEAGGTEKQGGC